MSLTFGLPQLVFWYGYKSQQTEETKCTRIESVCNFPICSTDNREPIFYSFHSGQELNVNVITTSILLVQYS